jgi:hypothetical protein
LSIRKNHVIDETTSQSTKPASWQVAGYPAKAGMQMFKYFPRKWGNIMILSASRRIFYCWIPASPV